VPDSSWKEQSEKKREEAHFDHPTGRFLGGRGETVREKCCGECHQGNIKNANPGELERREGPN